MNKRIQELAREAGFYANPDVEKFETFAKLVAEKERESCAKICDEFFKGNRDTNYSNTIAICIRGRK